MEEPGAQEDNAEDRDGYYPVYTFVERLSRHL
jgi:hypothetical protein